MQDIHFSPSSRPVEAAPFDQASSEASWAGRFFSSPASLLPAAELSAYPRLFLSSPCQGMLEAEEREARKALNALEAELPSCVRCQGGHCRYHIKGEGPARTRLLCIFEGPNSGEDLRGKPFQGEAGKLLDGILRSMGLRRDQIHLAPIIACRPRQGEEGGWSMNPTDAEIRRYLPSLYKRIQIVQPDIILALGVLPAKHLLNKQEHFRELHGQWFRRAFDQRDLLIFPTYHPTFLLRNPKEKPKAWQDICAFLRQPLSSEMPS
jgi:DNA polymerase